MLKLRGGTWAILALAFFAAAALFTAGAIPVSDTRLTIAPDKLHPPRVRPGHVAIREEFATAVAAGQRDALELFIARHPTDPLAKEARVRLEAMLR
ncbi:MAG: hypothetical protein Q8S29_20915 [Phreatobacter sp.]|nr:hypothetical protein [Phreatobacter sp.]